MKQVLLLLFLLLQFSCAPAVNSTYYVDASSGNDLNDASSPSSAWKSIEKVNNTKFKPGDKILFKRGEVWREELRVNSEGADGNPITYGAYGSGDMPVIKGSDRIAAFSPAGNTNIWRAQLNTEPSWIWFIKDDEIIWGNKQASQNSVTKDFDWYYDGRFLFIYAPSPPDKYYSSVEASARKYCINAEVRNFIVIENLHLQFPQYACIKVYENTVVRNNILEYSGINDTERRGDGVWIVGSNNEIINNIISNHSSHGINVNPSRYETNNNIIQYNTIFNNFHNNLDIRSGENGSAEGNIIRFNHLYCTDDFPRASVNGIFLQGYSDSKQIRNTEIYNNIIHNQTGSGIHFSRFVDGVDVQNNTVYTTKDENTACFYFFNGNGHVNMKNNIGADGAAWIVRLETTANKSFDQNLYFQNPGKRQNTARIGNQTFESFADYKSRAKLDQNSKWENPDFEQTAKGLFKSRNKISAGALSGIPDDKKSQVTELRVGASLNKTN